jgi:hypothetical protein
VQRLKELVMDCNDRLFQAVLLAVRDSILVLKRRFSSTTVGTIYLESPVFRVGPS